MKREVKVGREFEIRDVKERTQYLTEVTRSTIAICVVGAGVLSLLVTAATSAYQGDYGVLKTLWAVISLPLGWIIGHYFRGSNQRDNEDHKSTA